MKHDPCKFPVSYSEGGASVMATCEAPFAIKYQTESEHDFKIRAIRDFKLVLMFSRRIAIKDVKDAQARGRISDLFDNHTWISFIDGTYALVGLRFSQAEIPIVRNAAEYIRIESLSNLPIGAVLGNLEDASTRTRIQTYALDNDDVVNSVAIGKGRKNPAPRALFSSTKVSNQVQSTTPKKIGNPLVLEVPNP